MPGRVRCTALGAQPAAHHRVHGVPRCSPDGARPVRAHRAVLPGHGLAAGTCAPRPEGKGLWRSRKGQRALSGRRRAAQCAHPAAHGHVHPAGAGTGRDGHSGAEHHPSALCAGSAGERPDRGLCGQRGCVQLCQGSRAGAYQLCRHGREHQVDGGAHLHHFGGTQRAGRKRDGQRHSEVLQRPDQ